MRGRGPNCHLAHCVEFGRPANVRQSQKVLAVVEFGLVEVTAPRIHQYCRLERRARLRDAYADDPGEPALDPSQHPGQSSWIQAVEHEEGSIGAIWHDMLQRLERKIACPGSDPDEEFRRVDKAQVNDGMYLFANSCPRRR